MNNYDANIIDKNANIVDAMQAIDNVPESLTGFVLDADNRLVGTLTDGDIRRGFLSGLHLDDNVSRFMTTTFRSLKSGFSVDEFKRARKSGVSLLPVLDGDDHIVRVIDLKKRKSILPLECVIMAGGRGERLRPLTDEVPKPMLPLGGKPILEHNINRLIKFGIEKIYITVRYRGQQIIDHFGDGSSFGVSIEYLWEDKPLGTAGSLSLIKNIKTDYLLLMNSDIYTDADFEDLFLNVIKKEAEIGVASVTHSVKIPYGIFDAKDTIIYGLREKPIFTNYANAGIYILKKNLIELVPSDTYFDITDLINISIDKKLNVIHNPIIGYWVDIGQPQDYKNAQEIINHQSIQ
jgi:dTDP-glucose pyrophosphorylase